MHRRRARRPRGQARRTPQTRERAARSAPRPPARVCVLRRAPNGACGVGTARTSRGEACTHSGRRRRSRRPRSSRRGPTRAGGGVGRGNAPRGATKVDGSRDRSGARRLARRMCPGRLRRGRAHRGAADQREGRRPRPHRRFRQLRRPARSRSSLCPHGRRDHGRCTSVTRCERTDAGPLGCLGGALRTGHPRPMVFRGGFDTWRLAASQKRQGLSAHTPAYATPTRAVTWTRGRTRRSHTYRGDTVRS